MQKLQLTQRPPPRPVIGAETGQEESTQLPASNQAAAAAGGPRSSSSTAPPSCAGMPLAVQAATRAKVKVEESEEQDKQAQKENTVANRTCDVGAQRAVGVEG